MVTVVLALAFFFEYAFENRWITESGRVLLGLACGAAAFGAGEYFFRRGQRAYGQALAAAGVAFFYLSFWAAFSLYHLVPQLAALSLMVLTTAAAGFLAARYDSPAVALLGLAGGFATPLLLRGGDQPWFVLSYALVLSGGAVLATRVRRWRWPEALALVGVAVLYVSQVPARPFYAIFVIAYYALFAISGNVGRLHRRRNARRRSAGGIWAPAETGLSAAALCAGGLAIADYRRRPTAAMGAFAGFWIAYWWWHILAGYTPLLVLTAGYALFLGWPLWRALVRRQTLRLHELAILALNAGLVFRRVLLAVTGPYAPYVGLFAVALAIGSSRGGAPALARRYARRASLGRRRMGDSHPRRADPIRRLSSHRDLGRRSRRDGVDRRPARRAARGALRDGRPRRSWWRVWRSPTPVCTAALGNTSWS